MILSAVFVSMVQLAVLSGLFRLHPVLRKRHCSDWPEYQWAEICKRMRLQEVRSMDKVGVEKLKGIHCRYTVDRIFPINRPSFGFC